MNKYIKFISVAFSLLLCFSAVAYGQETTGNIEGTITDPAGARVAGASVELVSESFRRTITANNEGFFRALQLPVGQYTVNVTGGSFQPFSRKNVQVALGQTTPVNVTLAVAGTSAEVLVTDTDQLAIDPTSSKIQTNLSEKELQLLPKGVGFSSALRAVPGVRPEASSAGFSVDGATGVENSFVIDGQEVSNFRTGGLNDNNDLPFAIVRELQVKSGGFEAEFGGATGGVINVVTQSGGNSFHGGAGASFRASELNANLRPILRSDPRNFEYIRPEKQGGVGFFPTASLTGPIIKDRLWFAAVAAPQYITTTRPWTFTDGSRGSFTREDQFDYYFGRLDAAITDNLRVFSTYTYNPSKVNGLLPPFNTLRAASTVGSSSATNPDNQAQLGGRVAATNFNVGGNFVAHPNLVFSSRWSRGYLNERFDYTTNVGTYGVPNVTRFQCVTAGFQCVAGFNNVASNENILKDISIRKNFDVDASITVNNFAGRHQFKVGYQRFDVSNEVASGYVEPGRVLFYFGQTTAAEDGTTFGNRSGEVGYARLVLIGEFGQASSSNESIYIQDAWQPFSRLTLNLGVRFEREGVPSFTEGFDGIQFNFSDKIAPRLGFAYDVFGNAKLKIFGSYGQFFDRFKYELPRGSFGGNLFDDYRAPLLASTPDIFAYTKQYVLDNALVYTNFRVPSNDPTDFRVDPDLKPVRMTEYIGGVQWDMGANTILKGRFTHKQIDSAIEDIGYHDEDGNESYFIGNPGEGICALPACGRYSIPGAPSQKPVREYDALEVSVDKRFARNAFLNASYTLSRLYGNYSGLASTDEYSVNVGVARDSPNVNRFFDKPFGHAVVGGEANLGRLPTDRPHVFKAFGAYTFNRDSFIRLPSNNELEISTFFTAQSGTPVTTRVDLLDDAYVILNGRGDLGRTKMFNQTDLGLTYRYKFGRDNRWGLEFNVDVLNAFNQATVLQSYESASDHVFEGADFAPFGVVIGDEQDFDRAFFDGRITAAHIMTLINTCVDTDATTPGVQCDAVQPDARYQKAQVFQAPRNIRFGFRFTF